MVKRYRKRNRGLFNGLFTNAWSTKLFFIVFGILLLIPLLMNPGFPFVLIDKEYSPFFTNSIALLAVELAFPLCMIALASATIMVLLKVSGVVR